MDYKHNINEHVFDVYLVQGEFDWSQSQYPSYYNVLDKPLLLFLKDGGLFVTERQIDKKNPMREGRGVMIFPDGSIYEGDWVKDKQEGYGRFIHIDGDVYMGQWKENKAHGKGKYLHVDGSIYEGEWLQDL